MAIFAIICGWLGTVLVLVGPQLSTRRAMHVNALFAVTFLGIATCYDRVWYVFALQVAAFINNTIALRRFWDR